MTDVSEPVSGGRGEGAPVCASAYCGQAAYCSEAGVCLAEPLTAAPTIATPHAEEDA